ncbi:carboxynorspermidine decarboxylase [Erythrobacter litoralis]|uniref:Carboxynorspermidine/carboxyspermidine decarboxylase n=1 Tax=Erythrobacter litoralis TaxID=39960 RepID=A0A074MZ67_9SPHN|nr:carboxynorspermidine decarboxylase [Erythrobacter litoralis]AOL23797.1 carboxynorspermidine decarboxylase [Erythrobacter litoralis]KEO98719.1 carboxynorspermidine decarboxylase [Erythrobacter litoralis]
METKAGDPGAFAHFDLSRVDSPAFVVDAAKLRANCQVLADIRDAASADGACIKVFAALKAFSMWSTAPIIGEYLDGVSTSGLWEARLASEFYDGEIATYSAAFKPDELEEVCRLSDHVIFNSPGQMRRAALILDQAAATGGDVSVGLRINPQVATGEVPRYDPSSPGSRLGFPLDQLTEEHMEGVEGIHFHNLCEQSFEPLARTWDRVFDAIEPWFGQLKWINMGGGHHITRADYEREELVEFLKDAAADTGAEIIIEPGEAVALDAGILVGTLLDTGFNEVPIGVADVSATCHMPDVIEAPYRPAMLNELTDDSIPIRLGGPSCLAGDVIGDYRLPVPAEPGARFAFLDQAHYSMVKTNTFNGVALPSIWLWDSETDALECVRRFEYEDFRNRLS